MTTPVIIGNAELYLGDCLEILPTLGEVDTVITDPPYDENTHKNARTNALRNQSREYSDGGRTLVDFNSLTMDFPGLCGTLTEIAARWVVMTCSHQHAFTVFDLPEFIRLGCWAKIGAMPQISGDRPGQAHESVVILHRKGKKRWNGGGKHALWYGPVLKNRSEAAGVPTQKPLWLVNSFVDLFSESDETILDPFMGSGTTGVACMNLGRKFIGIEIEERYFQIACERIENSQRQGRLFA